MTTLTLDLGTSATKAAVWDGATLVALTRAPLETRHPAPGFAEQDPSSWWTSVVDACAELRDDATDAFGAVDAVGFSAARETFALFDADVRPLGPGILWSDRRAGDQVDGLGDPSAFRARTGVLPTAVAAQRSCVGSWSTTPMRSSRPVGSSRRATSCSLASPAAS